MITWEQASARSTPVDTHLLVRAARGVQDAADAAGGAMLRHSQDLYAVVVQRCVDEVGAWARDLGVLPEWPVDDLVCCAEHRRPLDFAGVELHSNAAAAVANIAALDHTLTEVAALFEEIDRETDATTLGTMIDIAAVRLVAHTVQQTGADEAWYSSVTTLLTWYLQHAGVDDDRLPALVRGAVEGRFSSWAAPSPRDVRAVVSRIGEGLGDRPAVDDATAVWRQARGVAVRSWRPSTYDVGWDGHLAYVDGREARRDPDRAARMRAALDLVRTSSAGGESLDLAKLVEWQEIVLGEPVRLRTTDAFAKRGEERYPWLDGLAGEIDAYLREASVLGTPPAWRAARVYLDVLFTHPFEDGNSRAARLALEHVLSAEGLTLRAPALLFDVPRRAAQPNVLAATVCTLASLTGPERLTAVSVDGGGELVGRDVRTHVDGSDVGRLVLGFDAPRADPGAVVAAWLRHPWSHDSFEDAKHSYLPVEDRHGHFTHRSITPDHFRQVPTEGLPDLDTRLRAALPSARSDPSTRRWSHRISEGLCVVFELVPEGLVLDDTESAAGAAPLLAEVLVYDQQLEALTVLVWTGTSRGPVDG